MEFMRVLLCLSFGLLVAAANDELVFAVERRTEGVECSPDNDIFFNMDITIEDFGGKCSSRDAKIIGGLLQRVAIEIEKEVRSVKAELDLTVCPVPISENSDGGRRNRRALSRQANVTVERNLQRKMFTYKSGGQYNRCGATSGRNRQRNLDELGSSAVCKIADKATYAAEIAVAVFKDAETVYDIVKEEALQCEIMRSAEKEVTLTKSALEEARKELKAVNEAEQRAREACTLAGSPTVTVDERISFVATARMASAVAMGAAEKIRGWLFVMEDGFEPDVCSGQVHNPEGVTPQAVYDYVNIATFGAEMADMSYKLAQAAYLDLRQKALECRDIQMAEDLVSSARMVLNDIKEGKVLAKKEVNNARAQLDRITNGGISMSDLSDSVQKAKRSSIAASTEAGRVHRLQVRMEKDVDGNVCSPVPMQGSSGNPSVAAVCDLARKATYGSDMATATYRAAQDAFKDLMSEALDCGEFGMGETTITATKQSLTQLKRLQKKAISRGKKAKAQCEKAKKNPSNLAKSMQTVESASRFTMSQAEEAETLLGTIRNTLDRNVCKREAKARRSDPSPTAVCQAASGATFAASMAAGADDAANKIFSSLKDRVLNCYDLQHGQKFIDAAIAVRNELTASKKATFATSKQARKLCKQAKRASSTSGLKGLMENAEVLSREAMRSAKSAGSQYRRLRDDFNGSFCTEMKVVGPPQSGSNGGPSSNTGPAVQSGPQASMNDWMEQIASMIYSKIPKFIQQEYNNLQLGASCIIEGFNVNVLMNALARVQDRAFLVTEDSC